jgi:hypothetical protein
MQYTGTSITMIQGAEEIIIYSPSNVNVHQGNRQFVTARPTKPHEHQNIEQLCTTTVAIDHSTMAKKKSLNTPASCYATSENIAQTRQYQKTLWIPSQVIEKHLDNVVVIYCPFNRRQLIDTLAPLYRSLIPKLSVQHKP